MTLAEARSPACLLFECVAGSHAYGTSHPGSDLDLRGVFAAPRRRVFAGTAPPQVSDAKHDETYYEIGRFIELLGKNNPNIIELLFAPADCVRSRDPLMDRIRPEMVMSKRAEASFAGYAMAQVRKARGLNKKIVRPMGGPRRGAASFCYVLEGQGSVPLEDWLSARGWDADRCGLVDVPHLRDLFAVFYDGDGTRGYRGLFRGEGATEPQFSSVAKGERPAAWMGFNRDAYRRYCREYAEYQTWLAERNEDRYATNAGHGRGYDSKNMMHTFRLLAMAEEIATEGAPHVRRPDAAELMRIRAGEFAYEDLIARAEEKVARIAVLFAASDLPDEPDLAALETALVEIREVFYAR